MPTAGDRPASGSGPGRWCLARSRPGAALRDDAPHLLDRQRLARLRDDPLERSDVVDGGDDGELPLGELDEFDAVACRHPELVAQDAGERLPGTTEPSAADYADPEGAHSVY